MSRQLSETFPVNRMPTGHFVRGASRAEEKFLTDWTIGFVLSTLAIVICVETSVNAHATVVAMLEIFSSSHPAESTVRAMVGPFIIGHPEIANAAVVLAKLNITFDAIVPASILTTRKR